ncbi:MAG: hypothetical protein QOE70_4785 [Chthoniobacter sp.]|nr:hypothetical protein [Chthoniobacter sp.]
MTKFCQMTKWGAWLTTYLVATQDASLGGQDAHPTRDVTGYSPSLPIARVGQTARVSSAMAVSASPSGCL